MQVQSYINKKVDPSIYIVDKYKLVLEELNFRIEKKNNERATEATKSKKLTVTKLESQAIEAASKSFGKELLLLEHIQNQLNKDDCWLDDLSPLNNISIEQLAIALYVGYEVELTSEEVLIEAYKENLKLHTPESDGVLAGMLFTLQELGIEIEGINK